VRDRQRWSLREVEKRSGLSNGYLSQVERNEIGHPSPTVLRKLAKGYRVDFLVLLQWAGYVDDDQLALTPNQAAALSTLGDPTTEELEALKGIVEVLRSKRTATSLAVALPRQELDAVAQEEIAGFARALLLEADALGKRPTPLDDLRAAADLVRVGEIELTPRDRAKLAARFGRWVELGWHRLRGALDYRTKSVWIKPELHPKQKRFTLSHEIGHAILPAHRETFAVVDDPRSLAPEVRALFEQEANYAAAQLLFQCGQLREEADASPITLERLCDYAELFGASIVSTVREVAESSEQDVAVAIAYQPRDDFGPTHFFCSQSFEQRYRWNSGLGPTARLREELVTAPREIRRSEWALTDAADRLTSLRVESLHTSWAAVTLVVREPGLRRTARRLAEAVR
jgi:HTH-type transcriptional regulator, competence development regulator